MTRLLKKLPVYVISVAVIIVLVYGLWPRPVKVDHATVQRGSLQVTIDDDGETRIREKYIVSAPLTGQLMRLLFHAGDIVEQNKTELAQIIPVAPHLLDSRSQAGLEARVLAAEAGVQQASANKDSAIELADLAQHKLMRAQQLIKSNSISQQDMDEAEHEFAMTKANVRAAEFAIIVRNFEREQAVAALARVADKSPERNSNTLQIVSPTSGKVLRVFREDSGVVEMGAPLLEIGNVKDLEIVLDILSTEAARIKPGDQVFIDRWGGEQTLKAIVRLIEPSAFLKVSALGVEEKRVNVIADFEDPWEDRQSLGNGFRVDARIVIHETAADSLKVAAGALLRHQGQWHVYRIRHSRAELVPVELGASNGLESEICSGLEEGDLVVLYPTEQIRAGVYLE